MKKHLTPLDSPLPASPTVAFLQAEHARTVAYLEEIRLPGSPTFDEGLILNAVDRLHEIEAAMPAEIRAQYITPIDPDEEIPF